MKTYHFRAIKLLFALPAIILATIAWSDAMWWLGNNTNIFPLNNLNNLIGSIFIVICMFAFVICVVRLTSTAKVEVVLSSEAVSFKWHGRFLFYKREDKIIPFSEIDTCFETDARGFHSLTIIMTNGKTYKISNFSLVGNEDYYALVSELPIFVENHKNRIKESAATDNSNVKTEISCAYTRYMDKMANDNLKK